jgi:hypothetical protein
MCTTARTSCSMLSAGICAVFAARSNGRRRPDPSYCYPATSSTVSLSVGPRTRRFL